MALSIDCGELGAFAKLQLIVALQVQPQLWGGTEEQSEPHGRISRDTNFPVNDGSNLVVGARSAKASSFMLISRGLVKSRNRISPG